MEKQLNKKQLAVFNDLREIRKSDYVRAISRLKAFERQAEPNLTTYNGTINRPYRLTLLKWCGRK